MTKIIIAELFARVILFSNFLIIMCKISFFVIYFMSIPVSSTFFWQNDQLTLKIQFNHHLLYGIVSSF